MSQHNYQQYPGPGQYATGQYSAGQAGGYPGQEQVQGMGPGVMPGMQHPYAAPAYYPQQPPNRSLLSMPNDRFFKGLLIGAAVAYLVTNEQVQRTVIKGVVKTWSLLQGGVEEVKERFGDAAAEIRQGKDG